MNAKEHFDDYCFKNHVRPQDQRAFLFDILDMIYEDFMPDSVERAKWIGEDLGRIGLYSSVTQEL